MAVNLFTGATNNNWGTAGNWSLGTVPTATDGHVTTFDATSPNCTVNASNRVCNAIDFTGYINTITMTFTITVSGNITYSSTMNVSGTGLMAVNGTCTLTSNGYSWPNNFNFSGSVTTTLVGNFIILGQIGLSSAVSPVVNRTTSETLSSNGFNMNGSAFSGTAEIILTGGTWSHASASYISNNLTLSGNVTVSGNVYYQTNTLKYASGTITVTGSQLVLRTCNLDTDGMIWNLAGFNGTTTITLLSNVIFSNTINTITLTINGAFTWSTGGLTVNGTLSGTAKIILTGGTWSGSNTTGIANNLDLQGNVTVSGNVYYRTGTLKYVSGTITVTSSTLNITGSCTLNTNGMSWNWVVLAAGALTVTLTSNCLIGGTLYNNGAGVRTINRTTSETLTVGDGISVSTGSFTGTASLIITGGTWTAGSTSATISNNFTIKGNVTIGTTVAYTTNTLTFDNTGGPYTVTTTGSTLYLYTNCTLNTDGITWATVTSPNSNTITINSTLSADTLSIAGTAQTFAGTVGFNVSIFSVTAISAITHTLAAGVTYTVTSLFQCKDSRIGSIVLFTSSSGTVRANLIMPNNGNNLCNVLASFTRINASGGRSITTFGGVITDCLNIVQYYDYPTTAA